MSSALMRWASSLVLISSSSPELEVDPLGDLRLCCWGREWWRMVVGGRMGEGWGRDCGEGGDRSRWWEGREGEWCGEMVWGLMLAIPLREGVLVEVRGVGV